MVCMENMERYSNVLVKKINIMDKIEFTQMMMDRTKEVAVRIEKW